jgi:hypothetical protein
VSADAPTAAGDARSRRGSSLSRRVAISYGPAVSVTRDDRARERDRDADQRDMEAAIRDGLVDEETMSEREADARAASRADREAAAADRREAAADRRAAADARDAARRSGE